MLDELTEEELNELNDSFDPEVNNFYFSSVDVRAIILSNWVNHTCIACCFTNLRTY